MWVAYCVAGGREVIDIMNVMMNMVGKCGRRGSVAEHVGTLCHHRLEYGRFCACDYVIVVMH